MARAKKEAALTPEERLQAALVPDWEWPYKLPENWCWTRIGMVSNFERGITFPAAAKEAAPTEDNIPCLRTANVQENLEIDDMIYVNRDFMKGNIAKLVRENDIIMSSANSRELVGKSSLVTHIPFPMTFGGFVLNIRAKEMSSKYLFYFLRHEFLAGKFIGESSQTTNIANINTTTLGNYEIPLPPLPEQQRIVDRIESLFAKLDEAKEKAQAVLDSFETRKAAILHKAFTGELTAKWREEHGVGMESWEKKSVGELCISLKYGTAKKSDASGNVVVLRMGNLQQGEIDWSDLAYSNDPDDIEKYKLFPGDVLFNRTNSAALVGKTAIYRGEHPAIYAGYLIKLDYDHDKIIGDYLNYALNTLDAKKYCNSVKTDGVNQSNINAKKIGAYSFNVPSIPEQEKIVSVIQKLLSKEQQTKEAAEIVLDQIELMKKSILARAFRGELGTNDPSEESAVELLKEIIRRG
ncbi:restriction endonuclease subunit S [Hominenteromicrobium sp.]|uniref:restriction endonuclease subunit S n=1 Tax=Hominenteromicrobium sp. TaxID=3073581 RepID=UPI003A8F7460